MGGSGGMNVKALEGVTTGLQFIQDHDGLHVETS